MKKRIVFICSPFRALSQDTAVAKKELNKNIQLVKAACRFAVNNGYIPFAPHLFAPNFLDDHIEAERNAGIQIGLEMLSHCDELWVVSDRISKGMKSEIAEAKKLNIKIRGLQEGLA